MKDVVEIKPNIIEKKKPNTKKELDNILNPIVKDWFYSRFPGYSLPQLFGVMEIHSRENILVSAPTGATKTLTGFLSILNELVDSADKNILENRIYAVYISPLKALNEDIKVNLLEPLEEIKKIALEKYGKEINIKVGVRGGDTSSYEKSKMLKDPPHILITTPESLAISLASQKFVENLKNVQWCIIDEIHALAENKRGVHLMLSIEMLEYLSGHLTRIGLSATVSPLEEVAHFLVGEERKCKIVNVQFIKDSDLQVLSPVDNLVDISYNELHSKTYQLIHDLIQKHKTTLVFTNTRAGTERVVHHLREKFPRDYIEAISEDEIENDYIEINEDENKINNDENFNESKNKTNNKEKINEKTKGEIDKKEIKTNKKEIKSIVNYIGNENKTENKESAAKGIGAHHGSLSKEHRHMLEKKLREGKIKCVVCSTSLELGIDIGYIDLVICLGSPKTVARALQRIGRSGHKLNETTKGRFVVMDRDDLVECSILLKNAKEKKIDLLHIPKNALDVLAQQILGYAIADVWDENELYNLIKKTYCYNNLKREDFDSLISYLAGEYSELEDRYIYSKIWRKDGKIGKKGKLIRILYMTNIGTIPSQGGVKVKLGNHIIGMLDESFLERLRKRDIFVLGGSTYEFRYARGMTAVVSVSIGKPPTVPRWVSESLPLSFDLANDISKLRRLINEKIQNGKSKNEIIKFIEEYTYVEKNTAIAIFNYIKEQYDYAKVSTDKEILIEHYKDDKGKKIVFHTLLGRRVNDCLSRAIAYIISKYEKSDVELGISDNGFYIATEKNINISEIIKVLKTSNLKEIMELSLEQTEILKRRFRHCAERSLMILRNYMGRVKRAGKQQSISSILINSVKSVSNNFPILEEARREVLEDLMDIKNTENFIEDLRQGKRKFIEINTSIPSPFAFQLILQGYSDVLKIDDKFDFLKRMHEMVLAKISLEKGKKGIKSDNLIADGFETPKIDLSNDPVKEFKDYIKLISDFYKAKKDKKMVKVINQLYELNEPLPLDIKFELAKIIHGKKYNSDILKDIKKYKKEIERNWPRELGMFLIEEVDKNFSYEKEWENLDDKTKESIKEEQNDKYKKLLMKQFLDIHKKISLEPLIYFELEKFIENPKNIFDTKFKKWMNGLLEPEAPKIWPKELIRYIEENRLR